MGSQPTPNLRQLRQYQSLSTKKERKDTFCNFSKPPKAPMRSCPVPRIYSVFKEDRPRPVSFREDAESTSFISESRLYSWREGRSYLDQCFLVERTLGRGSFGEVFRVRSRETGQPFACKRTILKYRGELDRIRRLSEVAKHEQLPGHPNCVTFYRAWEEDHHLYLLTEVCQCSLADILVEKHDFHERQLWNFIADILQGLAHLHRHRLIHMDVKPDNIFVGASGTCKLGDFGLVIDFSNGYPTDAVEGDPKYLAPECLSNVYTPASDVFSLGLVMLEAASDLVLPREGPLWHSLRQGKVPSLKQRGFSPEFESVMNLFLEPDPLLRVASGAALHLRPVKKVVRRNHVLRFFTNKAVSLKWCLQSLLVWPLVVLSFVARLFFTPLPPSSSPTKPSHTPVPPTTSLPHFPRTSSPLFDASRCGDTDARFLPKDHNAPTLSPDLASDFPPLDRSSLCSSSSSSRVFPAALTPIINSTPISCLKRRAGGAGVFSPLNLSSASSEDVVDGGGGGKFSFHDSSFSSLEATRDEEEGEGVSRGGRVGGSAPKPLAEGSWAPSGGGVPARNLLHLFNSADLSDEDC